MAVTADKVTVAATATVIAPVDPTRRRIVFKNNNATTIYVGGSGVDTTDGYPLEENEVLEVVQQHREDTSPQQAWYGIVSTGTQDINTILVDN
jgi:hypothetical protein